eukprot:GHVT01031411.1.p1 GENE.GHVT01031411.1~~GHVT01031411.1.p1  ORF type:complete len:937 (+),score=101.06 GHVT01031411.1:559-3369(+)
MKPPRIVVCFRIFGWFCECSSCSVVSVPMGGNRGVWKLRHLLLLLAASSWIGERVSAVACDRPVRKAPEVPSLNLPCGVIATAIGKQAQPIRAYTRRLFERRRSCAAASKHADENWIGVEGRQERDTRPAFAVARPTLGKAGAASAAKTNPVQQLRKFCPALLRSEKPQLPNCILEEVGALGRPARLLRRFWRHREATGQRPDGLSLPRRQGYYYSYLERILPLHAGGLPTATARAACTARVMKPTTRPVLAAVNVAPAASVEMTAVAAAAMSASSASATAAATPTASGIGTSTTAPGTAFGSAAAVTAAGVGAAMALLPEGGPEDSKLRGAWGSRFSSSFQSVCGFKSKRPPIVYTGGEFSGCGFVVLAGRLMDEKRRRMRDYLAFLGIPIFYLEELLPVKLDNPLVCPETNSRPLTNSDCFISKTLFENNSEISLECACDGATACATTDKLPNNDCSYMVRRPNPTNKENDGHDSFAETNQKRSGSALPAGFCPANVGVSFFAALPLPVSNATRRTPPQTPAEWQDLGREIVRRAFGSHETFANASRHASGQIRPTGNTETGKDGSTQLPPTAAHTAPELQSTASTSLGFPSAAPPLKAVRFLLLGGDGSIGWAYDFLRRTFQAHPGLPLVCPLPAGTFNDIANLAGWGNRLDGMSQLNRILEYVRVCDRAFDLDAWRVRTCGMKSSDNLLSRYILHSVGIGILARALHGLELSRRGNRGSRWPVSLRKAYVWYQGISRLFMREPLDATGVQVTYTLAGDDNRQRHLSIPSRVSSLHALNIPIYGGSQFLDASWATEAKCTQDGKLHIHAHTTPEMFSQLVFQQTQTRYLPSVTSLQVDVPENVPMWWILDGTGGSAVGGSMKLTLHGSLRILCGPKLAAHNTYPQQAKQHSDQSLATSDFTREKANQTQVTDRLPYRIVSVPPPSGARGQPDI